MSWLRGPSSRSADFRIRPLPRREDGAVSFAPMLSVHPRLGRFRSQVGVSPADLRMGVAAPRHIAFENQPQ